MLLGYVTSEDYENGKVLEICERIPVPKKQFEGSRKVFPGEKVRRCQEWTQEVVDCLRGEGILVAGLVDS